jgi:hypothetical protein
MSISVSFVGAQHRPEPLAASARVSGAAQKATSSDERAISAYLIIIIIIIIIILFRCGLDDQNPQDWDDIDTLHAEGLVSSIPQ